MNINALYVTNLGLLDNLGQTQIIPYLERLAKKGIKFYVLSFEKRENLKNKLLVEGVKRKLRDSHIEWTSLLYHRRWGNLWDLLKGLINTFNIVRARSVSILHARASIPVLIVWPIAKILKRKIIYDRRGTMVGDFTDDVNIKNIFSVRFFSSILNTIDRFIMRHSDATIVLSERALKILKEDPYLSGSGCIIETLPCCTDTSRFKTNNIRKDINLDLNGRFIMGYIGSLGTCYLLKEMAEFFKALKNKKKDAIFFIISHTDRKFIEGTLKERGLAPGIDYLITGATPDEVPSYIARCDLSIMLIKDVDCKIGSSPTKFGESLAAGVPVIVNRGIGDTEKIIRKENVGVIVESLKQDSYEKAIDQLLSLLNDEDALRQRCIETADRYLSLELGIQRYKDIYNKLAGRRDDI